MSEGFGQKRVIPTSRREIYVRIYHPLKAKSTIRTVLRSIVCYCLLKSECRPDRYWDDPRLKKTQGAHQEK